MTTRLVPATLIRPSTYNPRTADPARLELIALSLRKLGFLLPIYADPDGEILSGHQRHLVATEMLKWEHVPLRQTPPMTLDKRKAINIVFNRGTNDLRMSDNPEQLTERLLSLDIRKMGEALPDKTGDDRYPCMRSEAFSVDRLVKANSDRWLDYAARLAKVLSNHDITMPIVARRSNLQVVNGIGRLQNAAATREDVIETVFISDDEADFAEAMLNLLSMNFDLATRYADLLRHNSFRRSRNNDPKRVLGIGMLVPMGINVRQSFADTPENFAAFRRKYGERVLDFGAGRMEDVARLKAHDIDADAFEPFVLTPGTDVINPDLARDLTRHFLRKVASGKQWSSIFIQSVFNSVPFAEDRQHIVTLLSALAGAHTIVYAVTEGVRRADLMATLSEFHAADDRNRNNMRFAVDYEPNVVISEYSRLPKVQKYHTTEEFLALFRHRFNTVRIVRETGKQIFVSASSPANFVVGDLRAAIAFEFDLPYPDGTRMGLVDEALAAFAQRLGVAL